MNGITDIFYQDPKHHDLDVDQYLSVENITSKNAYGGSLDIQSLKDNDDAFKLVLEAHINRHEALVEGFSYIDQEHQRLNALTHVTKKDGGYLNVQLERLSSLGFESEQIKTEYLMSSPSTTGADELKSACQSIREDVKDKLDAQENTIKNIMARDVLVKLLFLQNIFRECLEYHQIHSDGVHEFSELYKAIDLQFNDTKGGFIKVLNIPLHALSKDGTARSETEEFIPINNDVPYLKEISILNKVSVIINVIYSLTHESINLNKTYNESIIHAMFRRGRENHSGSDFAPLRIKHLLEFYYGVCWDTFHDDLMQNHTVIRFMEIKQCFDDDLNIDSESFNEYTLPNLIVLHTEVTKLYRCILEFILITKATKRFIESIFMALPKPS